MFNSPGFRGLRMSVAVAWALLSGPAAAQSSSGATAAPLTETLTGEARSDYEAARQLLTLHQDLAALIRFRLAYDQVRDPRLLANIALCERNLGHPARAATLFQRALAEGASLFAPQQLEQLNELLEACLASVARVHVSVNVTEAVVQVDDQAVGRSPLPADVLLDPGAHRVRVVKAGYRDFSREMTVAGPGPMSLEASLEPELSGIVRVRAGEHDAIAIDGRVVAKAAWEAHLTPGPHSIDVTRDGAAPFRTDVEVRTNEARTLDVALGADRRIPTWLWVTGTTVVAIGLVIAAASVFHAADVHPAP